MDVPRITSLPIDPSRQSILDFPAELRILIYEFLFKRDGHLFLHNREAFYRDPDPLDELLLDGATVSSPEEDAEFRHGLGAGINLLATCRQIYYEASDTLYGQNDFVISRMVSKPHIHCMYDPEHYSFYPSRGTEYHQFFYAGQWVAQIGQNAQWLQKVKIDGDAVCECSGHLKVDILPLLRLNWSMPTCNIEFIHTGRYIPGSHSLECCSGSWSSEDRITRFESLLHALGDQDSLGIHRHYKYYRNLISIHISMWSSYFRGTATFRGVSPWGWGHRRSEWSSREFTMSTAGRSSEWITDYQILGESGDPARSLLDGEHFEEVATLIQRDVMYASGGCTIDIDERTIYGLDTSMLRILQWFSYAEDVKFTLPRTGCYVIIAALYHPNQAVYQNRYEIAWKGAKFLYNVKLYKGYAAWIARQAVEHDRAKMVIRIRDQAAQDVRVDLRHLDRLLVEREGLIGNGAKFVIQLEETAANEIITVSQASISVQTLRRHWFAYLTDLLDSAPQYINPEMTATHVDCHWNIIPGNDRPLTRPPSDEDWRSFLEDPASAYNRVEPRLRRRHQFPCPATRVMTYWFCLKHILCDMGPKEQNDPLCMMNLFDDFPFRCHQSCS